MAIDHDLEIIPVLNKVDMDSAMTDEVSDQIIDLIGCKREDIILSSGKTGIGIKELLDAVEARIPHPKGKVDAPLQALIFDSVFNSFRGVIVYFRIFNGIIKKGDKVRFFHTQKDYQADEVGVLQMTLQDKPELRAGDVGYLITGIKVSKEIKVGDTVVLTKFPDTPEIKRF
nr:EF-Tu/IF-2/RF-3 family GTPase [Candidatus Brachybacter algidus]